MKAMYVRFETMEGRFLGSYPIADGTIVDIDGLFHCVGIKDKIRISMEYRDLDEDE